jgi:S1-C subfamily serine protease
MVSSSLQLRQQTTITTTAAVLHTVSILVAVVFTSRVIWQIFMPDVSNIAKAVTVKIDGANSGSGAIISHQGNRYTVLSNWHVVDPRQRSTPDRYLTIETGDHHQYRADPRSIVRIGKLDLAILEFRSNYRYRVVALGNSDRLNEGHTIYVSGWADPSPQLRSRAYQFLVGNLSGRIDKPHDGYGLVYNVSALPGMSGGPIFDRRGNLVGINGRASTDLRTGMVSSVLGIDINRYRRSTQALGRK